MAKQHLTALTDWEKGALLEALERHLPHLETRHGRALLEKLSSAAAICIRENESKGGNR